MRAASALGGLLGAGTLVHELWASRSSDALHWGGIAMSAGIMAFATANLLEPRRRTAVAVATIVGLACAIAALALPLGR